MLRWALIFFLISILAGAMGFTGIAVGAAAAARILFFLAISLFVIFLVAGLVVGETLAGKP
jgi:uncharacterized membrane protein YtjA (UPF0391 family)